jgi:simple sugar transport system substrate-binding protein
MSVATPSRRALLQGVSAGAVAAALPSPRALAARQAIVGLIYVGARDDFGWNQSHAVAARALKSVPGVKVLEEENVAETIAVARSMESMITLDGANLIFPTSFGYFDPFMLDMARKFPKVEFRHASTLWSKEKHPPNAGGYFARLNQAHYVNGVAAGLSTAPGKIGFVAAKPIPYALSNINSTLLGARRTNPGATVQVVFTGAWSHPVREAEATNALIDAGCDVIACHVDSPKVVIETAERRGAKTCGHGTSQAALAPRGFITGAEFKWETAYKAFAGNLARDESLPNVLIGGYHNDMVQNTPFGAGAGEAARNAAAEAIAHLKAGGPIYVGPLRDNRGNRVIDQTYGNDDPRLDGMNYLLEGVAGSIT